MTLHHCRQLVLGTEAPHLFRRGLPSNANFPGAQGPRREKVDEDPIQGLSRALSHVRQDQRLSAPAKLLQALERGWQHARAQCQDLSANHGSQRHALKDTVQQLVHLGALCVAHAALAFALQTQVKVDVPVLMMPPQERNSLRVTNLEAQEQGQHFQAMRASIRIVAQEDVSCVEDVSTVFQRRLLPFEMREEVE
jgi:hypothetical protein